jgi:hypothetical protein
VRHTQGGPFQKTQATATGMLTMNNDCSLKHMNCVPAPQPRSLGNIPTPFPGSKMTRGLCGLKAPFGGISYLEPEVRFELTTCGLRILGGNDRRVMRRLVECQSVFKFYFGVGRDASLYRPVSPTL